MGKRRSDDDIFSLALGLAYLAKNAIRVRPLIHHDIQIMTVLQRSSVLGSKSMSASLGSSHHQPSLHEESQTTSVEKGRTVKQRASGASDGEPEALDLQKHNHLWLSS